MFDVENEVPLPDNRESYPFKTMKVGESFVVPKLKSGSVRTLAAQHKRVAGKEFTVRTVENNQLRVWRVK